MQKESTPPEFATVARAIDYLRRHQHRQPGLDEVAAYVHVSKYHFQRMFRRWAGVSPKEFLQYLTVERAKAALVNGRSTLEAAYGAGLSGNGRLHDLFVKLEACTPGEFRARGRGLTVRYADIETPFGTALVAETDRGICAFTFTAPAEAPLPTLRRQFPAAELVSGLGKHGRQLRAYFADWAPPPSPIHLDLSGTPFQVSVWRALLRIPSGAALAYRDVATAIGRPTASRAVGTAVGSNPVAYLIPCHRVLRGDGSLGGYRWGTERKQAINAYEACHLA